jgi:hypothetical protein
MLDCYVSLLADSGVSSSVDEFQLDIPQDGTYTHDGDVRLKGSGIYTPKADIFCTGS